jgi:hypothetical protein
MLQRSSSSYIDYVQSVPPFGTKDRTDIKVLTEYFKELEEESIRDNFVIVYELLDEMMDFGYPQTTESKILQEYALSHLQRRS